MCYIAQVDSKTVLITQEGSKEIGSQSCSNSATFGITNISYVRGSHFSDEEVNMRDAVMSYLNNEECTVPWKTEHIKRISS